MMFVFWFRKPGLSYLGLKYTVEVLNKKALPDSYPGGLLILLTILTEQLAEL